MKYLVFMLVLISPFVEAEIYKWTDEQGKVHFGDSPRTEDNAEKVVVDVISYEYVKVEEIEFYQSEKKQNKSTKVKMYSTNWCGYCKKARKYFNEKNINFVEYDIEKDSAANKRFKELGGKGVPLILVGKKKMSGFNSQRFDDIYQ